MRLIFFHYVFYSIKSLVFHWIPFSIVYAIITTKYSITNIFNDHEPHKICCKGWGNLPPLPIKKDPPPTFTRREGPPIKRKNTYRKRPPIWREFLGGFSKGRSARSISNL